SLSPSGCQRTSDECGNGRPLAQSTVAQTKEASSPAGMVRALDRFQIVQLASRLGGGGRGASWSWAPPPNRALPRLLPAWFKPAVDQGHRTVHRLGLHALLRGDDLYEAVDALDVRSAGGERTGGR